MSDIFTTHNIYPHAGSIKEHYSEHFDAVLIAFIPFFQVDSHRTDVNFSRSMAVSFEQAKDEIPVLKNISKPNATIYSANIDYPVDEIIYKNAKVYTWGEVVEGSGMKDFSELNKALRTSIGALRPIFQRQDLVEKLDNYTTKNGVWHPAEGHYDVISKARIYKTFRLLQKNKIVLVDEHFEDIKTVDIDNLGEEEFCNQITLHHYYIYSADKELLFSIDWDSFFFVIAADNMNMDKIHSANLFEGFLCDDQTTNEWDYREGEIAKELELEKVMKKKEKWWRFW